MRSSIVIMDSDREYARRLCKYFNSRNYMEVKALTCKSVDELSNLQKEYKIKALLIDENSFMNLPHEHRPDHIFVLLEERVSLVEPDHNIKTIPKFIRANVLMKKVMDGLDMSDLSLHTYDKEIQIIGVFSPVSRSGKTVFASTLGLELAKTEKTLLITLDEYQGILKAVDAPDLSDIMYYYKQGKYSWEHFGKAVCSCNKLDYIPPVRYPEDLKELTEQEMKEMFLTMSALGQYSCIVIDFGNLGKRCTNMLSICTKIYMPMVYDSISKRKMEEFEAYLEYIGRENLKDKFIKIQVPFYKLKQFHDLYSLETTEVAKLARQMTEASYAVE